MKIANSSDNEIRVHSEAAAEGDEGQSPLEIRMHSQHAAEGDDEDLLPAADPAARVPREGNGGEWTI